VIVRDGKIVGEGVNTVTASHDPTAHGEVNAIRAAAAGAGYIYAGRVRALHQLRALPDVPGGSVLGAA
jgi:tRNA(Arg) A34 adenosine deaminase TadA